MDYHLAQRLERLMVYHLESMSEVHSVDRSALMKAHLTAPYWDNCSALKLESQRASQLDCLMDMSRVSRLGY